MKIKSILSTGWKQLLLGMVLFALAILPLAGCSGIIEPEDSSFPSQDLSIDLVTHENQIRANLIVSNPGDSEFPGDKEFKGKMSLWNESGQLVGWGEADILSAIAPGESKELAALSWELDPGVYFITWGEPEYGGAVTVFFVGDTLSGTPEVVRSQSFQTKPADYGAEWENCGSIDSFTLTEDGSVTITGESPLPDQSCIFPLLYSWSGLVDGFSIGECAQVADGRWQVEMPASLEGDGPQLDDDNSYHLIIFSQDLRISPSEPFEALNSPTVQD